MCKETIDVSGLDTERTAYEVEQYLRGLPYVDNATADIISERITIEYDENIATHEQVLDEIEHSGCVPSNRIESFFDKVKYAVL